MPLNITELAYLLTISAVIDDKFNLLDTPLFTTAEKLDDYVYLINILEGESLNDYLQRTYGHNGPYHMDCSVYAQLASYVISNQWPRNGGQLLIAIDRDLGSYMLWSFKIPEMGYITFADYKVYEILPYMYTSYKGEWCVQVSTEDCLGLTKDGPRVLSMDNWMTDIKAGLKLYYSAVREDENPIEQTRKGMMSLYEKMGMLEKWKFFTEREVIDQ